jgi:N-acetylneuraminic acid mutarotase
MIRILSLFTVLLITIPVLADSWNQKADFGGIGRHRAVGTAIFNKGYIGMGHVNGTGIDISYKDWWEYDPASNSWTQKADYPIANHGGVAFSVGKKGYVGGGSYLNNEFYCYDPQLNTWQPIAPCPLSAGDTQGFSVQDKGYVYLSNQLAQYNPATNSWTLMADSPHSFSAWSCAFGASGSGFILSGNVLYEFKPSLNTWIMRAALPGEMSNGSSAFAIHDRGYVTCGYVGGLSTVTDEVWEFNPGNNTWTMVEKFPGTNRRFPVAFAINDLGYFGTGTNGINFNDFWQYNPTDLSIEDVAEIEFEVYPNPVHESMTIRIDEQLFNASKNCVVKLYGTDGKILLNKVVNTALFSLDKESLPEGIYILELGMDNKLYTRKRVIFI